MNLIDCFVTQVVGPPEEKYGKWWVPVVYVAEGCPGKTNLMCQTKEEALKVAKHYVFQA